MKLLSPINKAGSRSGISGNAEIYQGLRNPPTEHIQFHEAGVLTGIDYGCVVRTSRDLLC